MPDKILIAYATRCGATSEVARHIGRVLSEAGAMVEVHPVKEVDDLGPYQAVIVGSAIRAGRWLPEAVRFVKRHAAALSQLPVAYFVVCLTMKDDTPEHRSTVNSYLDPVRQQVPEVQPLDVGLFAGAMTYTQLPIVARLMAKAVKAPQGDFRDWPAVTSWASGLPSVLLHRG